MNSIERRIAHLDMDAFFASVELLRYPELRGKPVVIGGGSKHAPRLQEDGSRIFSTLKDYVGRGVTTTSTYEARALGVFSAMGIMKAAKLAPDAFLIPTDFDSYKRQSERFKAAVAELAPKIENRGIDEIYIDLTDHSEDSAKIAKKIKNAVFAATGLTCSICIAPNKLLAKIGSDLEKPDGLTILSITDMPTRIWPLAVKKVNGIGPKSTERLAEIGIHTVGDLARVNLNLLQATFSQNYGTWLSQVAQGIDSREVITNSEPKCISRETTFEHDLHAVSDRLQLSRIFSELCDRIALDLNRKGYISKTIGVKIRYLDFTIATRDITLPNPTANAEDIRAAARECLKRLPLDKKIRLLGIRTSSLINLNASENFPRGVQGDFFIS
nr:DNA polymerase IV [uncultured Undibacterium sp.]